MPEFVYILTNPTMPDLVKIGRTENLEERMRQLSSHSGIPVPFECYYCCEVENGVQIERSLHIGLGDHRINPAREFFRINPERVQALLEPHAIGNIIPDQNFVENQEEQDALNRERSRRPVFTFSMVDIPIGSKLTFTRDNTRVAKVTGDREIEFEGDRSSLSNITMRLLRDHHGRNPIAVRGPDFWLFENETLTDRRIRLESQPD